MIYLFCGTSVDAVRTKAFAWVAASRAKAPDASYVRLSPEETSAPALEDVSRASGLFFSKMLVLVDVPFSLKDAEVAVFSMLPLLEASPNPIAILAPGLSATLRKKIEPKAAKVFSVDHVETKPVRGFNARLVNALGAKDGKMLWKELVKAERLGDAPEMLHGLLQWKARDLMKKGSGVWSESEARALSRALIELLAESRSGGLSLPLLLEQFALSLQK